MSKLILYYYNYSNVTQQFTIKNLHVSKDTPTCIAYGYWDITNCKLESTNPWIDFEQKCTDSHSSIEPLDKWSDQLNLSKGQFYGNFGQFKKLLDLGYPLKIYLIIRFININSYITSENCIKTICHILNVLNTFPIFSGIIFKLEDPSFHDPFFSFPSDTEATILRKESMSHFMSFLSHLRKALLSNGKIDFLISICSYGLSETFVIPLTSLVDELHIKTCDMYLDKNYSHHHTAPFYCQQIMDTYLNYHIPSHKLFLTCSTYSNAFNKTEGIHEKALFNNNKVKYLHLPLAECLEYNDPITKGAYCYHHGTHDLYTYDNNISAKEKCNIVQTKQLGGIIINNIAFDKPFSNPRSIYSVIHSFFS